MEAYEIVQMARNKNRWCASDYIRALVTDWMELHGDRRYGDDKAVIGGIGRISGIPVTIVGIEKGKETKERVEHNFGSAHPEGYRKALRLMKQAEKFHRPILCIVDTAGAYAGVDAEERGQGQAIAENLYELANLKTPILSIIVGEGGSGGALALAVADRLWMMDLAYFSVVSPENCATILWKDAKDSDKAAQALHLTAEELKKLELIDEILPTVTSQFSAEETKTYQDMLKSIITNELKNLLAIPINQVLEERYEKYRKIGRP